MYREHEAEYDCVIFIVSSDCFPDAGRHFWTKISGLCLETSISYVRLRRRRSSCVAEDTAEACTTSTWDDNGISGLCALIHVVSSFFAAVLANPLCEALSAARLSFSITPMS